MLGANGDFASLNLFAYCGNNPTSREDSCGRTWSITLGIMAIGGVIGAAVSATSSALTQKVLTGSVNWKTVGVAFASGFVSGAVAASPLKITGQKIAGAIIGGASYIADCYVNDKAMRLDEAALAVGMGYLSGKIGGPGANEDMVLTRAVNTFRDVCQREYRRANQEYAQKAIASANYVFRNIISCTGWESVIRFSEGCGISSGISTKYSDLISDYGLFPQMPSWKPW